MAKLLLLLLLVMVMVTVVFEITVCYRSVLRGREGECGVEFLLLGGRGEVLVHAVETAVAVGEVVGGFRVQSLVMVICGAYS